MFFLFKINRLIPSANIYVNQFAVENAIKEADSYNKLARLLLPVVFKDESLKVCNSTGKHGAKAAKLMLHQEGVQSIYDFVKTHVETKTDWCRQGWQKKDKDAMKTSVQKKLNELKKTKQANGILRQKQTLN